MFGFTFNVNVTGRIEVVHQVVGDVPQPGEVLRLLRAIHAQGEKMATQQQEALDALVKIDEATNKAAEAQTATAEALTELSDDLDDLIAQNGTTVPADVLEKLKVASARIEATAEATKAQAEFSKALAGKWQKDPVPLPPPPPPEPIPDPDAPPV